MIARIAISRRSLVRACRAPLVTALLAAAGASSASACEGLRVEEAWVREPPPGSEVAAGFMRFANPGSAPLTIDAIASPCCAGVMIHRTERQGGTTRMTHLPVLTIAGGKSMTLAPGGMHLMMMGPTVPLTAGGAVEFDFGCGAHHMRVSVPIRADEP